MPAPEPPKSVVEFLHEVFLAPSWEARMLQAVFCLVFLFCYNMILTIAEIARAWAFRWLGPRPQARPVPECSDIVIVADIPPVPPIRPPDAVRNEPRASASTSSHLRHRLQRINELPAITLGHSVNCGCEDCCNRRFNRMTLIEEGWPE